MYNVNNLKLKSDDGISLNKINLEKFFEVYKHEDLGVVVTDSKFNIIEINDWAKKLLFDNSEINLNKAVSFMDLFSQNAQKKLKKKIKLHSSGDYSNMELLRLNTFPLDTENLEVYFKILDNAQQAKYQFVVMRDRNHYFKKESENREEYYKSILNIVEEERVHLGNELHENLAQDLYAIRIILQSFILKHGYSENILPAKKILTNSIHNLTRFSNGLIPYILKENAFTYSVNEVVKKNKEIVFDFTCIVDPNLNNQSSHVLFTLYNLIRLFYHDCKKIGKKDGVILELSSHSNMIRLSISEKTSFHDDSFEQLYSMSSLENLKSIITLYNGNFQFIRNKVRNRFIITLYVQ